jgi:cytoskeletal protein CcmA (bactofilin family)
MWRKEDGKPQPSSEISTGALKSIPGVGPMANNPKDAFGGAQPSSKAVACVSQGIKIKGELTGSEDLFIDGQVEGKINLEKSVLTVGPNATVKADITAREIVVRGRVEGKLFGSERIQIWNSARVHGDMKSERVAIEEGSELRGKMEAGKMTTSAAETPASGISKKSETGKPKEMQSNEGKASSGAAVAGAD